MSQEKEEKIDLYYTLKPMAWFTKFFGLWPHTVRRSSPGVSTVGLLWYFTVLAFYVYIFYLNLDKTFWNHFVEVTQSSIQTYGSWIQMLSGLAIAIVSIVVPMGTFRKQWTFFETMAEVDSILSTDFAVITPKKIFRSITIILMILQNAVLLLLFLFMFFVYSMVIKASPLHVCLSFYLANLPYSGVIMIFFFATTSLNRRFYYVNNILMQLAPREIPKNVFEICSRTSRNERHQPTISVSEIYSIYGNTMKKSMPMTPPRSSDDLKKEIKKLTMKLESREQNFLQKLLHREVIEVEEYKFMKMSSVEATIEHLTKLLDVHDMLLDCINLQNEILSFQILLIVAQIFVFEVFALFSLYRTLNNTKLSENLLALLNALWLTIYNFVLFMVMSSASQCVNEGKLTGTYCHKVINKISHTADPRIVEKLSIMSHQLTMRVPNITCGLFSFDWELMFSIVAATTIYLIFLIQFDVAGNSNNAPDTI